MAGVGCPCGWPIDNCHPEFAKGKPCGKAKHEAEVRRRLQLKRVPLRLEDGEVVGTAEVNERTSKITARVTDPVAAAKLALSLGDDGGAFSIAPAKDQAQRFADAEQERAERGNKGKRGQ